MSKDINKRTHQEAISRCLLVSLVVAFIMSFISVESFFQVKENVLSIDWFAYLHIFLLNFFPAIVACITAVIWERRTNTSAAVTRPVIKSERISPVTPQNYGNSLNGKETGSVKWFDVNKGFGFITRDSGTDVFVHFRALLIEGPKVLIEGQRVAFVISESERGLQAQEVVVLS